MCVGVVEGGAGGGDGMSMHVCLYIQYAQLCVVCVHDINSCACV